MFHHLDCGIEIQVSREGDLDQVQIEVFQVCVSIQREWGGGLRRQAPWWRWKRVVQPQAMVYEEGGMVGGRAGNAHSWI